MNAPRMLSRAAAAAYCGVSVNHFLAEVPVAPALIGKKRLWDRKAIDRYLDRLGGAGETPLSVEEWLERV